MFYDVYKKLCDEHGEKPYSLAVKLGAKGNAIVDQWKKGSTPRDPLLSNIADYFGVTKSYLRGEERGQKENPAAQGSEVKKELHSIIDAMSDEKAQKWLDFVKTMS